MAWDYAELSKAAKAAGGPEKLVNMIEEGAKAVGRVEPAAYVAVVMQCMSDNPIKLFA